MCLEQLDLSRYGRIIEPSAGGGAFSDELLTVHRPQVLALDLAPESPDIVRQDWFDFAEEWPGATLVVGNPPFGQQCTLAVRFMNHAFDVVGAQTVAFVLPRSFRKASVQRRITPGARLVRETILPPNSFLLEGKDYDLRAVFQVWERTATPRCLELAPTTSPYFSFTKKHEKHDFAVRRIGGKAGYAFVDRHDVSDQSNYFLKASSGVAVGDIIELINSLDVSVAKDGVGPNSLSKRELVTLFDAAYEGRSPSHG